MKYLYSLLLLFLFVFFAFNKKEIRHFPSKKAPFLELSLQGIQNYTEHSIQEIQNFLTYPLFLPQSSAQVLEDINKTGLHLASRLAVLKYIDTLTKDPILIRQGKYGFWKIVRTSLFKNWQQQIHTIFETMDHTPTLKTHQQFILKKLTHRIFKPSLSKRQKKNIEKLLSTMDQPNIPYTYLQGIGQEKEFGDSFTILSFNICFTPNDMPLVFGGMTRWEERLDSVTDLICDSQADIVCLQEVFDTSAHEALYEKLKNEYSHFYTNIGPWSFEGSFSTLGFENGLFVASKYPISDPQFIPFEKDNSHIHRGVFSFQINSKDAQPLGRVFTTHLEPFCSGKKLREQEIKQIITQMQSKQDNQIPLILCGDLNMLPDESKEWIDRYFIDDFQNKEPTHCDFTLTRWNHPEKPTLNPNQLDYTLLLQTNTHQIKSSLIKAFSVDDLEHAISDHHAMYSEVHPNF